MQLFTRLKTLVGSTLLAASLLLGIFTSISDFSLSQVVKLLTSLVS